MLSDSALEALLELLHRCEKIGAFPQQQESLLIGLIDKASGGTRPIGWFRALFRVWARARKSIWSEWEDEMDPDGIFAAGKGKSTEDVVWRQSFRAECAEEAEHAAIA
eukprot:12413027-Karenia_brevis.AAC.1